jgi:hypothetical protein
MTFLFQIVLIDTDRVPYLEAEVVQGQHGD